MRKEKIFRPKNENVYYVEIDTRKTKRNRTISDLLHIDADVFYIGAGKKVGQVETTDLNKARFWKDKSAAEAAGRRFDGAIVRIKEMTTRDFIELIEPENGDYVSNRNVKLLKSEKKYLKKLDEILEPYVFKNHKVPKDWEKWEECPNCNLRPLVDDLMKSTSCGCGEIGKHFFVSLDMSHKYTSNTMTRYYRGELRNQWNRTVKKMRNGNK